jgi:glucose uptake protein GlcU
VLLTIALFSIGMMLVKGDVMPLRVFVALALPTLVWGVFALVRDSVSNEKLVDAVFGALVALLSVVLLARPSAARRATL